MAERRRIRLAAVPYEEDDNDSTQNFRRLAYKDDGSYEPTTIKKKKKRRLKATLESKAAKNKSRSRRQVRRREPRTKNKVASNNGNLMEDLETTTWSLIKCGRKFIEKSIEEGKIQALRAAMRLRPDGDIDYQSRSGRVTRRRRKKNQLRRRPFLNPSSSEDSRSIRSLSSYGSHSDSYGTFSYSDGEPSMSLSVCSSKSSKKRRGSKSKSNLKADPSYDSLGENSIIAEDSYTTEDSSPSTEDSLTDQASSEDDRSVVRGAWSKIKKIAKKPHGEAESVKKEDKPNSALKVELMLEPESSDSWIASMQTDSNESFSTALNKELSYHRQMSSTAPLDPIQQRVDKKKGHQRKPTAELSDAEFLKVIRETVDQELGAKRTAETDSNQDVLAMIDMSTKQGTTSITTSHAEPTLSNADFLKAMQQENGVEEEQVEATSDEPILSNADFLKAMQQENGVEEEQVEATSDEPILSNADFLKAMQQENGVEEDQVEASSDEPILSNADFLKAMQQESGVIDDAQSSAPQNEQVVLSDELSNADFLKAMKLSLSATGGKFDQEPDICDVSTEANSVSEREEDKNTEPGFSNLDFLKALRQDGEVGDDSLSENKASNQTTVNTNFLIALKQLGGMDHDPSMYSHGKLETIQEVDSDPTMSEQSSSSTSQPTSYTFAEENVVVVVGIDGSHSDAAPLLKQDEADRNVEVLIMKPNESGPSNELPDLKCVSSEESDSHSDPTADTLQGNSSESGKDDIDDSDTAFVTADEILAEDDTQFFSVNTDKKGAENDEIGSSNSLDEILGDAKGYKVPAATNSEKFSLSETRNDEMDCTRASGAENRSNDSDKLQNRTEGLEDTAQDMVDDEKPRCSSETDIPGADIDHEHVCGEEATMEGRQDEESSPSSSDQGEGTRSPDSSQNNIEERDTLTRLMQVDESLTAKEKTTPIAEIENGISIDGSSPAGEVDASALSPTSEPPHRSEDRIAPVQSRMDINKAIGKKVLEGWTLLDSSCPRCVLPLMTDTTAVEAACIFCDYSRSMNAEHGAYLGVLAPPPPPPPRANKKAKKKRTKTRTTAAMETTSVAKHPNSLVAGSE